ncbi:MAG TPA: hypothetical protein VIS96_14555 [Terrimicrobiaceae bacterium]
MYLPVGCTLRPLFLDHGYVPEAFTLSRSVLDDHEAFLSVMILGIDRDSGTLRLNDFDGARLRLSPKPS